MVKTAIVILNWNTRKHLETFLPSLLKYSISPEYKIFVADNASTDDSIPFLKNNYPEIELIQLDKNYGFAEGYNKALSQVNAEYYIILNSDIEVTENWLQPLVSLLECDRSIAACMPKIKSYFNRDSFEYAGAAGGYIDKYGYPFCKGRIFDTLEKDNGQYDGIFEVFWATGACLAVKAKVFKQLGGFDSFFFAHQEEIDLCWRMQTAGYKIYCTTNSVVYHLGGGTLPKSNPFKTYLNFRNNLIMLYKNLPANIRFRIIFIRLLLDGIAAVKLLFGANPAELLSVLKAHFQFYRYVFTNKPLKSTNTLPSIIYKKSIVFQYYFRKNKLYSAIYRCTYN